MNKNKCNVITNKGVTLLALVITIIMVLLIAGVTIGTGTYNLEKAQGGAQFSELNMIQHAVLERYTKATLTHEAYPGILLDSDSAELADMKSLGIELKGKDTEYYKLTPSSGFKELGIRDEEDEYIVNYKTGEVFNFTEKKSKEGEILYVYAKEDN